MYLHLSPFSLDRAVVVAYVGVAAVSGGIGLSEYGPLEDVVDDGPGEVARGCEDGRVVEDAHLVAGDLVVLNSYIAQCDQLPEIKPYHTLPS